MKRIVSFLLALVCLSVGVSAAIPPAEEACPAIAAQSAALYDAVTGEFFYEKNIDGSVPAAFTVKLMTVMLAAESLQTDADVVLPSGFLDGVVYHSGLNFEAGETVKVKDLYYAVLVKNANEACNILALACGKTVEEFVAAMNEKAKALGMSATHFADTHGESKESYTTARDAVRLMAAFVENEELRSISNTTFYRMPATDRAEERLMYSSNLFIGAGEYGYAYASGGKNHYTSSSGYSQSVYSTFNGLKVITVVFHGGFEAEAHYGQMKAALEWVRANYKRITVMKTGMICGSTRVILCRNSDTVTLVAGADLSYVVPSDYDSSMIAWQVSVPDEVEAPVREGDELGTVTVTYDGVEIGTLPALAGQTADRDAGMTIRYRIGQFFAHPAVVTLLVLVVLAVALFLGYTVYYNKKRRKNKKG